MGQIDFVNHLQAEARRVTVVGDDMQSIYRFRGADYSAFPRFQATYDHPGLQCSLTVNYRCASIWMHVRKGVAQPGKHVQMCARVAGRKGVAAFHVCAYCKWA